MEQCEHATKVSELVDGELSLEESESITLHLESCSVCRDARLSFLSARDKLRSYKAVPDSRVRQRLLTAIGDRRDKSLWQQSLRVPFPAAAATVIMLIALIGWSVLAGAWRRDAGSQSITRVTPTTSGNMGSNASSETDLARFDRGDRLVIFKEPRAQEVDRQR